jgi:hypothetical protein
MPVNRNKISQFLCHLNDYQPLKTTSAFAIGMTISCSKINQSICHLNDYQPLKNVSVFSTTEVLVHS